jgi:hypothetical protein
MREIEDDWQRDDTLCVVRVLELKGVHCQRIRMPSREKHHSGRDEDVSQRSVAHRKIAYKKVTYAALSTVVTVTAF